MHAFLDSSIGGATVLTETRLISERNGHRETLILLACHLYKLPLFVPTKVQNAGHHALVGSSSILQAKRHHVVAIHTNGCDECCVYRIGGCMGIWL